MVINLAVGCSDVCKLICQNTDFDASAKISSSLKSIFVKTSRRERCRILKLSGIGLFRGIL